MKNFNKFRKLSFLLLLFSFLVLPLLSVKQVEAKITSLDIVSPTSGNPCYAQSALSCVILNNFEATNKDAPHAYAVRIDGKLVSEMYNVTFPLEGFQDHQITTFFEYEIAVEPFTALLEEGVYDLTVTYYSKNGDAWNPDGTDSQMNAVVIDNTKPTISLLGNASTTITLGDSYLDAGATASDSPRGSPEDISSRINITNPVNTLVPGEYVVRYNVTDYAGNVADEVIRTVTVAPKQLTISNPSLTTSKVYDANNSALVTAGTLAGVEAGHSVSVSALASYNDKNVGSGKTITVSYTLSGPDADKYITPDDYIVSNGVISQKSLTVSGSSVTTKVYDGTTAASITGASLSGLETGDSVTLNNHTVGIFNNKHVGSAKAVSHSMSISGGDAGNYSLVPPTLSGTITARVVNVSAQADNKVYDGGTSSSVTPVGAALQSGDSYSSQGTQTFDTKNVGNNKTIRPSGASINDGNSGNNYSINYVDNTSGVISPKSINVSGASVTTKVYDASTAATISGASLSGVISGDNVILNNQTVGIFNNKHVGSAKAVSHTMYISGTDAANYSLVAPSLSGSITVRAVNVTAQADNKVYDGGTSSGVTPVGAALQSGDSYSSQGTQAYDNKNVGTGKTLIPSGASINDGNSGNNYSINYINNTTGSISKASLNITGASVDTKVYDGYASATISGATLIGVLGSDDVSLSNPSSGLYDDRNVGVSKHVNSHIGIAGADANNYVLNSPSLTGTITAATVNVTAQSDSKEYDGNNLSSMQPQGASLKIGDGWNSLGAQVFDNKNVGSGKTLIPSGASINDGNGGNNYIINYVNSATGQITAKALSVIGASVVSKTYDGNSDATISGAALSGLISGDSVSLANNTSGVFSDKNVGDAKAVTTSMTITGTDNTNYSLSQPNLTGKIKVRTVNVSAQTDSKVYDGTNSSSVVPVGDALQSSDSYFSLGTQVFNSKNVASGKSLIPSGASINDGNSGNNYSINYVNNTTGLITAKPLSVTGASVTTKTYDGNSNAQITGATLSGLINPDVVSLDNHTSGVFVDENVGTKAVTTNMTISGSDSNNYSLSQPSLNGTITKATINEAVITGVTPPAFGETPVTTLPGSDQFSATISWNPNDPTFAGSTVYTANIVVTPSSNYTLDGVGANFFTVAGATATNPVGSGSVAAVFPTTAAAPPSLVTINNISGLSLPLTGNTPVSAITETDEYTGTVSWSPDHDPFFGETSYTATVNLTAKPGYTFSGITANFFSVAGASSVTNPADSGVVTVVFPATEAAVINILDIPGVTAPLTGNAPVSSITETSQYTGLVSWSPNDNPFLGAVDYTATITLTAKTGFTLTGVAANSFTVAGASSVNNSINSGVVTAVFPNTSAAPITISNISGVTAPVTGNAPVSSITETSQFTGSVNWSPGHNPFLGDQVYVATISLSPKAGYTLTGVADNFFSVSGASASYVTGSGVVIATFPATAPAVIDILDIPGVTAPVVGEIPNTTAIDTNQYSGTISWSPADNPFLGEEVYTATISLTAKTGFTLTGVTANSFTVAGATATNSADSGIVTATFPATA
ncbi:MAG: YDG domain-containing protein, partial [Bacteroidales bacterium]|nr:YDG domain-containing protein [Bacteroidales bacterium]